MSVNIEQIQAHYATLICDGTTEGGPCDHVFDGPVVGEGNTAEVVDPAKHLAQSFGWEVVEHEPGDLECYCPDCSARRADK